jgi:hypothetical protein
MKQSILAIALLALISIAGCKKDDNKDGDGTAVAKLGSVYSDSTNLTTFYIYSPSGKISEIRNSAAVYKTFFHYNANTVLVEFTVFDHVDSSVPQILYYLNGQGLAQRAVYRLPNGTTVKKVEYVYDAGGNLTNEVWYYALDSLPYFSRSITNSGGNATNISDMLRDSTGGLAPFAEYTSTYFTDKNNSIGNINAGESFLGASSKNPAKDLTITVGGINTASSTYNYLYDESGRIISKVCYNKYDTATTFIRGDSLVYNYY